MTWMLTLWLLLAANAFGQRSAPPPPNLPRQLGSALPALARSAMLRYLRDRISVEAMPLPATLRTARVMEGHQRIAFSQAEYPVTVTLRHHGEVVARSVRRGQGVARNTIAAALRAMRSGALPDRVTPQFLRRLTIELEILGRGVDVGKDRLHNTLRPGLEGLKFTLGVDDPSLRGPHFADLYQEALVLPSTAYVLGWDAERMRKRCLTEIRWRAENHTLRRRWGLFSSLHYLAYPAASDPGAPTGTWLLYRGKILVPEWRPDDRAGRLALARRVGDALVRGQKEFGTYCPPAGEARLVDQLHVARALLKLRKALPDRSFYSTSGQLLLSYVAKKFVTSDGSDTQAWVFTDDPRQQVKATALFVLAAAEDQRNEKIQAVQKKMVAFLRHRMNETGRFVDSDGNVLDDVSAAVALLAMQTFEPNPKDAQWIEGVEALLYAAGEMGAVAGEAKPLSAEAEAWLGRAILAGQCGADGRFRRFVQRFAQRLTSRQARQGAPADELGAIRTPAGNAETVPTGLAVLLLTEARTLKAVLSRQDAARASQAIPAGQHFCRQMVFKSEEAYFTPTPSQWSGMVRQRAAAAAVSLAAGAITVEALLAE